MNLFTMLLAGAKNMAKSLLAYATKETLPNYESFTVNGQLINGPGVYTNFVNKTNYITLPVTTATSSIDMIVKAHTPNSFNDYSIIQATSGSKGIVYRITGSNTVHIWLSSNGSNWNVCSDYYPSLTIPTNTDVWFRVKWDGTKYDFGYSLDGTNYIWGNPKTSSEPIYWNEGSQNLGGCSWENYAWQNGGLIYIPGTKIYIDGSLTFDGDIAQEGTDYTVVGNLLQLTNTDYTGFTQSNTISLNRSLDTFDIQNFFDPGNDSWELKFKMRTGPSINTCYLLGAKKSNYSMLLGTYSGYGSQSFRIWLSSNGTSWDISDGNTTSSISANTIYFVKFGYDGTQYYLLISTDDITYTNKWSKTSTQKIAPVTNIFEVGHAWDNYEGAFNGILFMNDFEIVSGNKVIWTNNLNAVQVGDTVKINNGLGLADYKLNAFQNNTGYQNEFTSSATVKSIDIDKDNNVVYELENLNASSNKIKLNTETNYECYSNGTNDIYLKQGELVTTNDYRFTNINCYRGPCFYNFTSTAYIILPNAFLPETNSWEMLFHVRTGSNITTRQKIVGCSAGYDYAIPCLTLESNSYFSLNISANGSSWNITNSNSSLRAMANTDYWFKVYFTGTQYKLDYSLDGINYSNCLTVNSTNSVYQNASRSFIAVGADRYSSAVSASYPWLGAIYFKDCYIKINDESWFDGSTQIIGNPNSYFIRGTLTEDNKVYSGFSESNYLVLPIVFAPGNNSWEWFFKFKYVANSSNSQVLFSQGVSYACSIGIATSGQVKLTLSNSSSNYNMLSATGTTVLTNGNTYYVSVVFTGSSYNVYLSEDGENWINEINYSSTTSIIPRGDVWTIGANINNNSSAFYPFKGEIDLKESYITIGTNSWFSGVSATKLGYGIYSVWGNGTSGILLRETNNKNIYAGLNYAYLYLDNPIDFQNMDTWALTLKTYFYNFRDDRLLNSHFEDYRVPIVKTNNGYIEISLTSNGTTYDIANQYRSSKQLNKNTWYYIKLYFNGNAYKIDVSTTGAFNGEEVNYINIESSNKLYSDSHSVWNFMNDITNKTYYSDAKIDMNESSFTVNETTYNLGWGDVTSQFYEKTSDTSVAPITISAKSNVDNELLINNSYYTVDPTKNISTPIDFDKIYISSTDDYSRITLNISNDTVNLITGAELTEDKLMIDTKKYSKFDLDYLTGYDTTVSISGKPYEQYEFPTYVKRGTDCILTLTKPGSTIDSYVKTVNIDRDLYLKKMSITISSGNLVADKISLVINGSCNWEVTNTNELTIDVYQNDSLAYTIEKEGYATFRDSYVVIDNPFVTSEKTITATLSKVYKYTFNVTPATATIDYTYNNLYAKGDNWIQVYANSYLKYVITADGYEKVENEIKSVSSDSTLNITLNAISELTLTRSLNLMNINNRGTVITLDGNDDYIASAKYTTPNLNYYPYLLCDKVLPLSTARKWEIQTGYRYLGGSNMPLIFGSSAENFHKGGIKFYCRDNRFRIDFSTSNNTYYLADQALGSVATESGYEYRFKIMQTISDNAWTENDGGGTSSVFQVYYKKSDRNVTTNIEAVGNGGTDSDVVCDANYDSSNAWHAFNSNSAIWAPSNQRAVIEYFYRPYAVRPTSVTIINDDTLNNMKSGIIGGSTDGFDWDTLYTITDRGQQKNLSETYFINTEKKYNWFGLSITERYNDYDVIEKEYFIENNTQLQVTLADNFFKQSLYGDSSQDIAEFLYRDGFWLLNGQVVNIANYLNITGTPEENDIIKVYYDTVVTKEPVTTTNIKQIIIDGFPFTYSSDYTLMYEASRTAKKYNIVDGELVENPNYVECKNPDTVEPFAFLNTPMNLANNYSLGHIDLSQTKCYINDELYWEAIHTPSVNEDVLVTRGYGLDSNDYMISNIIDDFNGDLACKAKVTEIEDNQASVTPNYYTTNSLTINSKLNNSPVDAEIDTIYELPTKNITFNIIDSNGNVDDASIKLNTYKSDSRSIKLTKGYRHIHVESIPNQEIEFYVNNQKYIINDSNPVLDIDIPQTNFETYGPSFYGYIIRENGVLFDERSCIYLNNDNVNMLVHVFKVNTDLTGCTIKYIIGDKTYTTIDGQVYCYSGQTITYEISKENYATIIDTYTVPIENINNSTFTVSYKLDNLVTLTLNSDVADVTYTIRSLGYEPVNNTITTKKGGVTLSGNDVKVAETLFRGITITEEE